MLQGQNNFYHLYLHSTVPVQQNSFITTRRKYRDLINTLKYNIAI